MRDLTKAQLTVGLLACFAMAWGLFQQAYEATDQIYAFGIMALQLFLILLLSFVLLALLEWVKIFDLKTNSILVLVTLIAIRLFSSLTL